MISTIFNLYSEYFRRVKMATDKNYFNFLHMPLPSAAYECQNHWVPGLSRSQGELEIRTWLWSPLRKVPMTSLAVLPPLMMMVWEKTRQKKIGSLLTSKLAVSILDCRKIPAEETALASHANYPFQCLLILLRDVTFVWIIIVIRAFFCARTYRCTD